MLAHKKDSLGQLKYGFLKPDGTLQIDYSYEEASPFDQFGFARVVLNGQASTKQFATGAYQSKNQLILSKEDVQWLVKNKVSKIRIVNVAKKKMYPYNISNERQQKIQQTAACIQQEL